MGSVTARLESLGIALPEPSLPGANYVPFVREADLIFVTGQLSQWNGERRYIGKVGQVYDLDAGREAARLAALNVIAQLSVALDGDLTRVRRCVRIGVYVNSAPGFHDQSQVANGASDLFIDLFGEAGRHTRLAIGVAALPYDVAAEVEGVFAVD
ncbi:MAG: RidA family protein [Pseudomonadota bacterium]